MTNPAGFVTQLAVMDSGELVEQLHELRSVQIIRKQVLANELEAQQFDTGDTLLALVMPGGLLYASYKKAAYNRAKKKLDEVNEQIAAYADGLSMMQARLRPVTIARLE
jgi:pyruvate/oxaloacetate carboxyltransferase